MKYRLEKASDRKFKEAIEINTIEELMEFIEKEGDIIIFNDPRGKTILIYDGYVE